MNRFFSTRTPFAIRVFFLLLLALVLRLGALAFFVQPPASDERQYLGIAQEIASNHRFALHNTVTAHRPPLYPLLLALTGGGNSNLLIPRILQILAGTITLALVGALAWRVSGSRTVVLATLALGALSPAWISSNSKILSESFFTLFFYGGLLLFGLGVSPDERNSTTRIVASGVLLGLATLTRSVILLLPPMWFAWFLLSPTRRPLAKRVLLLCVVWGLTFVPWTIRNAIRFEAFVPVNTMAGIVMYQGLYPDPQGYGFVPWDRIDEVAQTTDEVERSKVLVKKCLETYRDDPGRVARYAVAKILWLATPFNGDSFGMGSPTNPHTLVVYFFLALFLVSWGFRKPTDPNLSEGNVVRKKILVSVLLYFVAMAVLFYGSPRFRMPIDPILWIGAGMGFERIAGLHRSVREPILVGGLGALLVLYFAGAEVKETIFGIANNVFGYSSLWEGS